MPDTILRAWSAEAKKPTEPTLPLKSLHSYGMKSRLVKVKINDYKCSNLYVLQKEIRM